MNIKPLFNNDKDITLEGYLRKCGVESPKDYIELNSLVAYCSIESPLCYDNMEEAIELLADAIVDTKDIVIICDSDCDGYCSSAIAYQFLIERNVPKDNIRVLFHTSKQHGLSKDIIEQLNNIDINNICLVWLPDAGTNDVEQCAYLNSLGVSVLVTDHHNEESKNNSAIIINNQTSDKVKNKDLCGTGVTHKLISEYCKRIDNRIYQEMIDIVALATIGDVCDLRSLENRTILKWGLTHINNPLLKAMCNEFINGDITPISLGWNVVPKINAVCRGNNQELKEKLFYAMAIGYDIDNVITEIRKAHTTQRNTVNELYEKVLSVKPIGDRVKIFEFENTPYTGLIATKLSDHYACPCMVVHKHDDIYSGSMRSPCELKDKLNDSGLMTLCMGHSQACGVGWKIKNTNDLSTYCEKLDLTPSEKNVIISTDNVLINPDVFEIVDKGKDLWGHGIPEPIIHLSNVTINGLDIKELGKTKSTVKFLYGDIECVAFFVSKDRKQALHVGENVNIRLEIIGTPTINTWRNKRTKQIIIKDWEVC